MTLGNVTVLGLSFTPSSVNLNGKQVVFSFINTVRLAQQRDNLKMSKLLFGKIPLSVKLFDMLIIRVCFMAVTI